MTPHFLRVRDLYELRLSVIMLTYAVRTSRRVRAWRPPVNQPARSWEVGGSSSVLRKSTGSLRCRAGSVQASAKRSPSIRRNKTRCASCSSPIEDDLAARGCRARRFPLEAGASVRGPFALGILNWRPGLPFDCAQGRQPRRTSIIDSAVLRACVRVVWLGARIGVVAAVPLALEDADDAGADEGEARAVRAVGRMVDIFLPAARGELLAPEFDRVRAGAERFG